MQSLSNGSYQIHYYIDWQFTSNIHKQRPSSIIMMIRKIWLGFFCVLCFDSAKIYWSYTMKCIIRWINSYGKYIFYMWSCLLELILISCLVPLHLKNSYCFILSFHVGVWTASVIKAIVILRDSIHQIHINKHLIVS